MNSYYTLIWKDLNNSGIVNFKSFISFDNLKVYVKEYIRGAKMKNLRAVDTEKTIYYVEIEDEEVEE